MHTLSDSALCADARDHIAITGRPQPCGKQAVAGVYSPLLTIALTSLWLLLHFLCGDNRPAKISV